MQQTEITLQKKFTKCPCTPWTIAIAVSGFLFAPVMMFGGAATLPLLEMLYQEPGFEVAWTFCLVPLLCAALMSLVQIPCAIGLLMRKKWGLNGMYRYTGITLVLMLISNTFYAIEGITTGSEYSQLVQSLAIGYCLYLLACWAYLRKLRGIRN